jgi:predicted RNA methylase
MEHADLTSKQYNILEPSAGIGDIVDKLREEGYDNLQCVEINYTMAEILKLKGYEIIQDDILHIHPTIDPLDNDNLMPIWERIIMNPPFEQGQDMEHVRYCYNNFLAEGGILVSVMSAGVRTNTTKKYMAFRDWLATIDHEWITYNFDFKKAFNATGTSTVILKLTKDESN